jgi:L-ascorbate metabolism protein UlaG (beta-lactamase superfamily)
VTVFDDFRAASVPAGAVGLMWLGQATVALRVDGAVVLVDPFLSTHPERLVPPPCSGADARDIDVVLVTHDHLDHLDDATLAAVAAASPKAVIVTPREVVGRVVGLGIDEGRVRGLAAWETTSVAGVAVRAVPAKHGLDMRDAYRLGPFLGYVVGERAPVYHSGDTIPFEGLVEGLTPLGVSLALLPINGRDEAREAAGIVGNLDAREAAELAAAIGADAVSPLHWDMFASNPGDPGALVRAAPPCAVVVPAHASPYVHVPGIGAA